MIFRKKNVAIIVDMVKISDRYEIWHEFVNTHKRNVRGVKSNRIRNLESHTYKTDDLL